MYEHDGRVVLHDDGTATVTVVGGDDWTVAHRSAGGFVARKVRGGHVLAVRWDSPRPRVFETCDEAIAELLATFAR
jgi:hypothetical protein